LRRLYKNTLIMKKSKYKICFICPKAYTLFNKDIREVIGGSIAALYFLSKELVTRADMDISFIVADYGQSVKEIYSNIKIYRSFRFRAPVLNRVLDVAGALKKSASDIYVHRALTSFSGVMAILCRLMGKKFIYMLACDHEIDGRYEDQAGPIASFFSNLVFKYANLVIVQNSKQRKILLDRKSKNIKTLKSAMYIRTLEKKDDGFILWVCRSVPHKRPDILLDIARRRPDKRFVMISAGIKERNRFHRELLSKVEGIPNVEFKGYVPFDEMHTYFERARVFVSTSSMEGFPFAFIQAAAAKTPIVSLSINPDGFLEKYKCGFFCDDNINILEQRIDDLCADDVLFTRMSANAFKYVKENHSIDKVAEQFYNMVRAVR